MNLPYPHVDINFEVYPGTCGEGGRAFAELIERIGEETGAESVLMPQLPDVRLVAEATDLPVVAPYADALEPGREVAAAGEGYPDAIRPGWGSYLITRSVSGDMVEESPSTECVFPPVGESTPPPCSHDSVERLGMDAGQNEYLRCRECESVIVTFTPDSGWRRQREALVREERDWNPLLDALRRDHAGPQGDPRREDPERGGSLADRVRRTWRRWLE